jgi:hypothetical protein
MTGIAALYLLAAVIVLVFLPETRGRTLAPSEAGVRSICPGARSRA